MFPEFRALWCWGTSFCQEYPTLVASIRTTLVSRGSENTRSTTVRTYHESRSAPSLSASVAYVALPDSPGTCISGLRKRGTEWRYQKAAAYFLGRQLA